MVGSVRGRNLDVRVVTLLRMIVLHWLVIMCKWVEVGLNHCLPSVPGL